MDLTSVKDQYIIIKMMLSIFLFKGLVDISLLCTVVGNEGFSDFQSYFSARMPDSSNMCLDMGVGRT